MSQWFIITHSETQIRTEKKFTLATPIHSIKSSLYSITGTPPGRMNLQLRDEDGDLLEDNLQDGKTLGDYDTYDYIRLHVVDTSPQTEFSDLADTSKVKKFELDEEQYESRPDSFRKFKERNQGLFQKKEPSKEAKSEEPDFPEDIVGKRCQIPGDRRGTVRFVGKLPKKAGIFVGVELDEPLGKNDGIPCSTLTLRWKMLTVER
ncbi:putative Tubulin-folding cofactor B [Blattamonas nauphoetae]|uniref:Tubulin-folding cofactor B n=1 Tax=Blattamonas nauphoetae TaxID=2049346 RepID=A0ABQ9Y4M9_9EUKA|nr:putative Tubulin-folding cofactor B [Blattamonas nauphoetae]